MKLHLTPRAIFLTRHGESEYNVSGKIGGDSNLSQRGRKYAAALPKLIKDNIGDVPLTVSFHPFLFLELELALQGYA